MAETPDISKLVNNLFNAIQHQSQSAHAGIVTMAAAALDSQLTECLKASMRQLSKRMYSRLFDSLGPLSTFSNKIAMAYALEIVDADVYGQLETIRQIRNAMAHSPKRLHLESESISGLLAKLQLAHSKPAKPLIVFFERVKAINETLESHLLRVRGVPQANG
jgi:DNA-binding MltR family transcriptional regulator